MSLLIESIKIFNGRLYNLQRHENRMQRSRAALLSQDFPPIKLRKHINIPNDLNKGLVKCRIVYGVEIEEITYVPYVSKNIRTLKLVKDSSIDYAHKYLDRDHINDLLAQRDDCDDIIIVKDGMLTDSSYSNIALLRNGVWYTPSTNLLNGTRRQQLIEQGRIIEKKIPVNDINQYEKVSLINAMIGLNKTCVDIQSIY